MLCGGTGEEREVTVEVEQLLEAVRPDIVAVLGISPPVLQATHFKTQVVAGTNYFVRVCVGSEKHVHVRIFKHFSGSVELQGVQHKDGVGAGEPLLYF